MKKMVLLAFVLTLIPLHVAGRFVSIDIDGVSMTQEIAPDFTLTDIDGNTFSFSDYQGKVVLLNFFVTSCNSSVEEMTHLKILYEEFGEDLTIISISPENETVLRDFREDHDIGWTIAEDTANVFEAYAVHATPTLVIIDRQGYICYIHAGLTEESVLRPEIESLLPKTIYVDDDNVAGPWNGTKEHPYQNITSGLEHASDNDIVFVQNGTYYEHVSINKSISLIGENRSTTFIDGNGTGTVVSIYSNFVTVRGFTIQNSGSKLSSKGIYVHHSNGSNIYHNIIINNGVGIELKYSNNEVTFNSISNNIWGIYVDNSNNSILTDNSILRHFIGISLYHSSSNAIFHNNFIDNTHQVGQFDYYSHRTNIWDNGYPSGGNYWSDYNGNDTDQDGIGDIPYSIIPYIPIENTFCKADTDGRDDYPLMGMFSDFNATSEYNVQTICNSSISNFQFNGTAVCFNVTGENDTTGFCRICIPTALMNDNYRVFVNGTEISHTLLPFSNSTHSYLYFTYEHSTQEVVIIPEFPTWASMLLILIMLTVATAIYKRRI